MSRDHFDDECAGCRPAMVDVKTGRPLADDSIEMTTVNRLWGETTLEERQAWHRVTCQNSRALPDMKHTKAFVDRLEAALVALQTKERS
jgi:hypothetical protein